MINARSETVHEKPGVPLRVSAPAVRDPGERLVRVAARGRGRSSHTGSGPGTPTSSRLPDCGERWEKGRRAGRDLHDSDDRGFSPALADIHHRQPVIVDDGEVDAWLDPASPFERIAGMARAAFAGPFDRWRVEPRGEQCAERRPGAASARRRVSRRGPALPPSPYSSRCLSSRRPPRPKIVLPALILLAPNYQAPRGFEYAPAEELRQRAGTENHALGVITSAVGWGRWTSGSGKRCRGAECRLCVDRIRRNRRLRARTHPGRRTPARRPVQDASGPRARGAALAGVRREYPPRGAKARRFAHPLGTRAGWRSMLRPNRPMPRRARGTGRSGR